MVPLNDQTFVVDVFRLFHEQHLVTMGPITTDFTGSFGEMKFPVSCLVPDSSHPLPIDPSIEELQAGLWLV